MSAFRSRSLVRVALVGAAMLAACDAPTAPVRVSSITLTPTGTTLTVGTTQQFSANVLSSSGSTISGANVTWSSSAQSVATVSSSGLVTALAAGSTVITATSGSVSRTATVLVELPICENAAGTPLAVPTTRNGAMNQSPCRMYGMFNAVGYPLSIASESGVKVDVTATGFAPGVLIESVDGFFWVERPPSSGNTTSVRGVLEPGNYRVWVLSSVEPSATQTFTLTTIVSGGSCGSGDVTNTLDLGTSSAAAITDASCILFDGPPAVGWRVTLSETSRVRVSATSAAFAPTVAVSNADVAMLLSYNIASAPGTTSTIIALPAGEYVVWGASFEYRNGTVQVGVEIEPPCPASGALAIGATVNGALAATDCVALHHPGAYADVWTFTVGAPTNVQLDLTSPIFDTFLELRSDSDTLIAWDDDGGDGFNSRISLPLAPGVYRVWASSFGSARTGAYALSAAALGGAIQLERATSPVRRLSSPSAKPELPARRPWPAPRSGGTGRR